MICHFHMFHHYHTTGPLLTLNHIHHTLNVLNFEVKINYAGTTIQETILPQYSPKYSSRHEHVLLFTHVPPLLHSPLPHI